MKLAMKTLSQAYEGYQRNLAQNRERLDFFLDLRKDFIKEKIDLLPLKGVDLLIRAYPSLGLRSMTDMDLLIHPKDVFEVKRLLEVKGLKWSPDESLCYSLPDSCIELDIGWDIWYLPDTSGLWKRSCERPYGEVSVRTLHPEDALTYLVAYMVAHRGTINSVYVKDIDYFLAAERAHIQWDPWVASVESLGLRPAAYRGLSYAARNGARNIPEEVLTRLRPRRFLEKALMFYYEKNVTENFKPRISYLHTWLAYPGLAGKARLLRKKFLLSRLEAELRYGIKNTPAYLRLLFLRPFALFFRGLYFLPKDILISYFK